MKALATSFFAALALAGGVAYADSASSGDTGNPPFAAVYADQARDLGTAQIRRPLEPVDAAGLATSGDPDDAGSTMLAGGDGGDDGSTMLADGDWDGNGSTMLASGDGDDNGLTMLADGDWDGNGSTMLAAGGGDTATQVA
jgi:hypothetical protein